MKSILKTLTNILRRGGFAFLYYPLSMVFAICLAALSIWIISNNSLTNLKLLFSLEWSFAFGAFFSAACCVIAKKSDDKQSTFVIANIIAGIITIGTFLAVYFSKGVTISADVLLRVVAAIAISFLLFLLVPTFRSYRIHYNEMVNMTVKSFFIAVVYSLVIMLGSFFVAFAVQSLLYSEMSSKVYSYIAIISALIGYAFFLGYYPEFKKVESIDDERIEKGIKQARFAEILFQNIMIPIIAALTIVLFIWSVRILITRDWPDYNQIIAIFTTYSLVGLFVYYLVSSHEKMIAKLYKRIIPFTIIVFLAFEAYSIVNQIMLYGVKPMEYAISFVFIFAIVSSILFIFIPVNKNYIPSIVAIGLITIFVLPVVGIGDASYSFQTMRLESILSRNDMIKNNAVVPNASISSKDKKDITDATNYLFQQENKKAPAWLLVTMPSIQSFKSAYGFDQEFYDPGRSPNVVSTYISLRPDNLTIPLDGYQYLIQRDMSQNIQNSTIVTAKGTYQITYGSNVSGTKSGNATPNIIVKKDNKTLIDTNLDEFASTLKAKYFTTSIGLSKGDQKIPQKELSYEIKGEGVQLSIYFQFVNFNDDGNGNKSDGFELSGILFKEIA